jgi:hypothetical protein
VALAVEVVAADSEDDRNDGGRGVWQNVDVVLVLVVVLVEHEDDIPVQGFHCVSTGRKPETTTTANEDVINKRLHQGGDRLAKALISSSFEVVTRLVTNYLTSEVLLDYSEF